MMAYTVEMMAVERVVASVKRFSTFCASKELPFDMEDAMLFWINKVILKTRELSDKELKMKQPLMDSPCHQKPDLMNALAHCMLEPVEFSRVVQYSCSLTYAYQTQCICLVMTNKNLMQIRVLWGLAGV
ncbi:hypothetical protein cypCar_00027052 [Cyprinus carpio]|nr:hypothetical protein cypCar_00027052 [Cyprinus carpio]